MNKIIIFAACTCLVLASCNDFLEEKPKSLLSSRDFNKTDRKSTRLNSSHW